MWDAKHKNAKNAIPLKIFMQQEIVQQRIGKPPSSMFMHLTFLVCVSQSNSKSCS